MKHDYTDIFRRTQRLAPFIDFEKEYTFFYDETNNIKKLRVRETDFNNAFESNFVLGGVCFKGARPDVSGIFEGLLIQNPKEAKFKYIAKGEFTDCLRWAKLELFLQNLLSLPLFVHYSWLNLLYYSVVDIVESALVNSNVAGRLSVDDRILKNALYNTCKENMRGTIAIMYKYEYPNIDIAAMESFIYEVIGLIDGYKANGINAQAASELKLLLLEKKTGSDMPFIVDETSHEPITSLFPLYMRPVYTFVNSVHHFDKEAEIEEQFKDVEIEVNGKKVVFDFIDSQSDLLIQASDITMGLFGKLSKFINVHSMGELHKIISGLDAQQKRNLDLIRAIQRKSLAESQGFKHAVDSIEEIMKAEFVLGI